MPYSPIYKWRSFISDVIAGLGIAYHTHEHYKQYDEMCRKKEVGINTAAYFAGLLVRYGVQSGAEKLVPQVVPFLRGDSKLASAILFGSLASSLFARSMLNFKY